MKRMRLQSQKFCKVTSFCSERIAYSPNITINQTYSMATANGMRFEAKIRNHYKASGLNYSQYPQYRIL